MNSVFPYICLRRIEHLSTIHRSILHQVLIVSRVFVVVHAVDKHYNFRNFGLNFSEIIEIVLSFHANLQFGFTKKNISLLIVNNDWRQL